MYDKYYLVGGGTAGGVVANRLSKIPRFKVLVLEAGGDPNIFTTIPGFYNNLLGQPSIDYSYDIVKQKAACLSAVSFWKLIIVF